MNPVKNRLKHRRVRNRLCSGKIIYDIIIVVSKSRQPVWKKCLRLFWYRDPSIIQVVRRKR